MNNLLIERRRDMEKKEKSSLAERLFSLSIKDILNRDLYKHQIKPIPDRFRSAEEYRRCFVPHLLEETRTELSSSFKSLSRSPVFEIHSVEIKEGSGSSSNKVYQITLKNTGTIDATYQPKCGDVIALTKERPRQIDDLNPLHLAYVFFSDGDLTVFVRSARAIPSLHEYPILPYKQNGHLIRFGVFLMNSTTNIRIWNALHNEDPNSTLIQSVLQENSLVFHFDDLKKTKKVASMAIGDVLPKEYGYVVIVVVLYCVLNFWMAFQVGGARKRYKVAYPTLYATESENKDTLFRLIFLVQQILYFV